MKTLQAALDAPDVTDDQLVELYRLLGLASLYLGDEARAREAYERLLQARPDFELPRNAPPKLRQLYARIKEDIKSRRVRPVTLLVDPIPDPTGGEPVQVDARIEDMALGAKAKLFFRRAGDAGLQLGGLRPRRGPAPRIATRPPCPPTSCPPRPTPMRWSTTSRSRTRRSGGWPAGGTRSTRSSSRSCRSSRPPSPRRSAAPGPGTRAPGSGWAWAPSLWEAPPRGVALATSEERGRVPITIRVNP